MRMKIRGFLGIVFCCMLLLTGCSETELEERCFPMLVAVGYDDGKVLYDVVFPSTTNSGDSKSNVENSPKAEKDSFEKAKSEYESRLNKVADYNHLKVIVLEEELIQEAKTFEEMLNYLTDTEAFPRNTYVCAVEDVEDLFEFKEHASQDLGTYLEEYISKHEEQKAHILTLGDLLDEKENQAMILYMPYLEVEKNYLEWGGYVNILGDMWKDF